MLIFGIETATMTLSLALVQREDGVDRVISESFYPPPAQHSALLPGEIGSMLNRAEKRIDELDAIVVGLGPGSFTGLRVGLATARAIAFARHIPLIGASSLHAMALGALRTHDGLAAGDLLVPLFDARKGEVYGGFYRVGDHGTLTVEKGEFVCPPQRLVQDLSSEKHLFLFGPGRQAYSALHSLPRLDQESDPTPGAAALIATLENLPSYRDWESAKQAACALEPHYVRSSDHEWKMIHP